MSTNRLVIAKSPSTPRCPVEAVIEANENSGVMGDAIAGLSIGTTVAMNAMLTQRGADVVCVTTAGFEDSPYIQQTI